MKPICYILLLTCLVFSACKKKSAAEEPAPTPAAPTPPALLPACVTLPEPPVPFGWIDSSIVDDKNVNAFRFNPLNPDEIIYIVNGDAFEQNKMYLYKFTTNQRIYLSNCGNSLPQFSTKGWIVFNRNDNNIYKIKLNGDSLTQLTTDYLCSHPMWDHSENYIYCHQAASGFEKAQLLKLNLLGQLVSKVETEYPNTVPCRSNDNLYYLKTVNDKIGIFLRNQAANTETLVLLSNKILTGTQNDFLNLELDNNEAYLYWTNGNGVLRYNLQNQTTDTLLKHCPNYTFLNPIVSSNSRELTFSCRIYKQLTVQIMHREYRTFELNLITKEWRELKMFAN